MPTAFVTTKNNNDSVFLSVDTHGLRASSSIFLNNHFIGTFADSFNNLFLGTNLGLKDNVITITTQVFRIPPELTESTVDYRIDGAANVVPDNPMSSSKNFQENSPIVPHNMVYFFI